MEGEVSNANLNTLLYDMAKKLDQKDYWKQLMSPMEEELIRTKLLSKETWTSFLLLESTSSDSEMDVWIAMRVRALLFDQWIPCLFPTSQVFCSTILASKEIYTEYVVRPDEIYNLLEEEMVMYASVKSFIVRERERETFR
jgi:hypothetical protein